MAFTNSQTLLKQSFIVFNMMQDTDPSNALMYEVRYEMSLDHTSPTTHGLVDVPQKGEFPPGWLTAIQGVVCIRKHNLGGTEKGAHSFVFRTREQNLWRQKRKERLFTTAGE